MSDVVLKLPEDVLPFAQMQSGDVRRASDPVLAYQNQALKDYVSVKQFLPLPQRAPTVILDIGCGVAGIDVYLYRWYAGECHLHLLDGDEFNPSERGGYRARTVFRNTHDATERMLLENDVPLSRFTLHEALRDRPTTTISGLSGVELVISLRSWGFHYPIEAYLQTVGGLMAPDATLIVDARAGTDVLSILRERGFYGAIKAAEGEMYTRIVAFRGTT